MHLGFDKKIEHDYFKRVETFRYDLNFNDHKPITILHLSGGYIQITKKKLNSIKKIMLIRHLMINSTLLYEWLIESIGKCFVFFPYALAIKSKKMPNAGICFRM